jgi:hypothetical protein
LKREDRRRIWKRNSIKTKKEKSLCQRSGRLTIIEGRRQRDVIGKVETVQSILSFLT